jgi:hypothetical protein
MARGNRLLSTQGLLSMMRAKQLSRTIALYKTDLGIVDDHVVEAALRRFNVLLAIGHPASSTRAGQCSILTAAMLLARSTAV